MKLTLTHELPFVTVKVAYQGVEIAVPKVLIDTGSATTILATDIVAAIRIAPERTDILHTIRGVGGAEVVFERTVDYVEVGTQRLTNFPIEIGGMDYGFDINGILGTDFLIRAGAIINLHDMKITFLQGISV